MSKAAHQPENNAQQARSHTAWAIGGLAALMLGAAFAAVPLYRLFCSATGYGGTTQTATQAPMAHGTRKFAVRFDANVAPGLNWRFAPETPQVMLTAGETATVFFRVTNLSGESVAAQARFNVSPDQAGAWFDKISCFCFSEQKLVAHETVEMPVVFFLDPKLEQDRSMDAVDALTLSYTFFASPAGQKSGAAEPPAKSGKS